MKTIIEQAREVGFSVKNFNPPIITTQHSNGSWVSVGGKLERFAALVEAAHTERLLAGVEMPEAFAYLCDWGDDKYGLSHQIVYYGEPGSAIEDDWNCHPKVHNNTKLFTADQLHETVASAVAKKDAEIDTLKAENERLTRQAFSIAVERDELRMELGDLPEAQAEMLTTVKQLKAENERLRADAARYQHLKNYYGYSYSIQPDSPAEHGIEYQWQQGTYEERNNGLDLTIDLDIESKRKLLNEEEQP